MLFSSDVLVSHHVYSVLGYYPKTQEVIVCNPWGDNNGTPFAKTGSSKDGLSSLGDGELLSKTLTGITRFVADKLNPFKC